MKKTYILDTNVLLSDSNSLFGFEEHDLVLPLIVLEELDRHKDRQDEVGRNAREVVRKLADLTKVNKDFIFNPLLLKILWGAGGSLPVDEKETVRIAKAGTFEAYVDWSVSVNSWRMEPNELFIHKIKKTQPYFGRLLTTYNIAAKEIGRAHV